MHIVEIIFILLGASLFCITLLKYLKMPTMFGYLLLGIGIGPHGFKFIEQSHHIAEIAELGIMAVMFTLGLKFSVTKIMSSKQYVFGLGGLQVSSTLVLATVVTKYALGVSWYEAFLFGSVVTMSSTAVISKLLIDQGEVHTPHGTRSIAILIFQDLAVIPLLVYFAYDPSDTGAPLYTTILSSLAVIAILVFVAPRVMPPLVDFFANQRSNEIFTVFALVLVVGISLLTHLAGLSMVLGSFLAGMLLSESRHRYLIEDIIRPFREIFLGFFFVSIGLLLSPEVFTEQWLLILVATVLVVVFKPLIIYGLTRAMHTHQWTAMQVGASLGGTGEFGFVLLTAAATATGSELLQVMLAVNLVCMFTPTFLLGLVTKLRNSLGSSEWLLQARDLTRIASQTGDLKDHVILCGFGHNSRVIIRMLKKHDIPWVAIESDYERSKAAQEAGFNVVFGDARNAESLIALGIFKAKSLIITHGVQSATVQTVQAAKGVAPSLPITVKVLGDTDIEEVRDAGASYLSIAAMETGATMAARVMQEYGISPQAISHDVRQMHEDMIKHGGSNLFQSSVMDASDNDHVPRPGKIRLLEGSKATGMTVTQLLALLKGSKVEFLHLERNHKTVPSEENEVLQANDDIVISGNQYDLDAAEALLRGE